MTNEPENIITAAPPNDADAELAVISSIVFEPEAMRLAEEILLADDFYRPDYKACYAAMLDLNLTSKPIDLVTLKNKLEERGEYEQIGGNTLLASVASAAATSANIAYYAKIVADKAMRRRLILLARNIDAMSRDEGLSVEEVMSDTEKRILELSKTRHSRDYERLGDVLDEALVKLEEIYANGEDISGIPTGFIDFDNITAGLHKSDLIIIAARPGVGKTALALNIALNAAVFHKVPTAVFSLEMSNIQVAHRFLSAFSMVEAGKLKTGKLSGDGGSDWTKIAEAIGKLHDAPVFLDDTPSITAAALRDKCRQLKLEHNLGLIVVDYLQLMGSDRRNRTDTRQNEVSEISRSLKALAREMDVPVLAMAQLNRAAVGRSYPVLSDLRESGSIEQDADMVCFIHREDPNNPETENKGEAKLIIGKHRNGALGTIELMYLDKYVKFANKAHD